MLPPSTLTKPEWPPNYTGVFQWRQQQLIKLRQNRELMLGAFAFYAKNPVAFINHWVDTYDPRNAGKTLTYIPFVLFQRQEDMVNFLHACVEGEANGLTEKARDIGATWVACAFSVWLWRFYPGAAVGWGSRKEALVDRIGDPDSIFEKIRIIINRLPKDFWPVGFNPSEHMPFMRVVNPESGSTITGESGDNIGRGGRKLIYFKDESAHYERPEKIEAALADNTNVQIDISSVNGPGNVFHRRREGGEEWFGGPARKDKTNVFVMDWSDHPAKDLDWYNRRRAKAIDDGLLHVFAQEVERNYFAAVEGAIIPIEWLNAAVDAHVALGMPIAGEWISALDVADEGGDKNAQAARQGPILQYCEDWAEGDTGQTARRAVANCKALGILEFQYDSVGVGSGVKSEVNRLELEKELPKGFHAVKWNAGAAPLEKDRPIDPDDNQSPLNEELFMNLKIQGWWQLRRRFEKTFNAVVHGRIYPHDELISIPSTLPRLNQIKKELTQPTFGQSTGSLKMMVNKKPPGTKSPNLADAIMMLYWPVPDDGPKVAMFLAKAHAA